MKKIFLYLTLFVIICFSSDTALKYSISKEIDNQPPYYLSFASIGANLLESRLDCWAKINTVSSHEEMSQYLLLVLNHLKLPADANKFLYQDNEEIMLVQYDFNYKNKNYYFMLQTNQMEKNSYLLMTLIDKQNDIELRQTEKNLRKLFDCTAYYQYKGLINARPDYAGQEILLRVAMKNLHADIKNIYRDDQIISMTGFSHAVGLNITPVNVSGDQYNVQAAIRSNPQENNSEIYLGFPLILNDY